MNRIRVRFAPSPTGTLHIGGARTALFNWLFARHNHGSFILRIEDTDLERSHEESAQGIIQGLRWLGLNWDEGPDQPGEYGPYRQSERLPIYNKYLQKLLESGQAYYCFCTPEQLALEREKAQREKRDYRYSGCCQSIPMEEAKLRINKGERAVIRFRTPTEGDCVVHDLIRGDVIFKNSLLDDFIIAKSDGWPTYNFAVVVDDHEMLISHVIRAEEHLSNTPKQIHIYEALGWKLPQFAHASMILAPDRSKLSKRHGATSVQEFQAQGYLPEALINYLALLGWSSGDDQDIWDLQELVERFSLTGISRSPAIYDIEKLSWMNGHYLSAASSQRIADLLVNEARQRGYLNNDDEQQKFQKIIALIKTRVKSVNDILDEAAYFFTDIQSYDEKGISKYFLKDNSIALLQTALQICESNITFIAEQLEGELRQKAEEMGIKASQLIHPIRLAISGRTATPGLFEVMEILGKDRCIDRIKKAILYVQSLKR